MSDSNKKGSFLAFVSAVLAGILAICPLYPSSAFAKRPNKKLSLPSENQDVSSETGEISEDLKRDAALKLSKYGVDLSRAYGVEEVEFEFEGASYKLTRMKLGPAEKDNKTLGQKASNFFKADEQYIFLEKRGDDLAVPLTGSRWRASLGNWIIRPFGRPLLSYRINDGILTIGGSGGRAIDLRAYDMELSVRIANPNAKLASDTAKALSDFMPGFGVSQKDFLVTANEERAVQRVLNTLRITQGSRSAVIFTESQGTEVLKAVRQRLPRTWLGFRLTPEINSGASLVGMIEKRVRQLSVIARSMPTVLFVEGMYTVRGIGSHSGSPSDVFDMIRTDISSGALAIVGTDMSDSFQQTMQNTIKSLFTKVTLEDPTPAELLQKILYKFQGAHRSEPSDEMLSLILDYAKGFDVVNPEPDRTQRLVDEILKWMNDNAVPRDQAVTREIVDQVIKDAYGLDPSLNSQAARAERLSRLQDVLDSRIVGMDRAKQAALDMTHQALKGFHDGRGPAVSMLLAGPRGTGKSEFVDAYAEGMGLNVVRFNMSEFAYPGSQAQFIGQVISALGKNPFAVLFFDEIEKASLEAQNILLTMMDSEIFRAQIPDNVRHRMQFVKASARNATVFFATNAGGSYVANQFQSGETRKGIRGTHWNDDQLRRQLEKENLSIPLIDRIKSVLPAYPPTKDAFRHLARLIVERQIKNIERGCNCTIEITNLDAYIEALVEEIYSPDMSNREVVRSLSEFIGTAAASENLAIGRTNKLTLKMPNEETGPENILADPEFRQRISSLEDKMKAEIIGQDQAVEAITEAVIAYFSDLFHGSKNVLFLVLLGSTGTGKTESAKALAKSWFGSEDSAVVIPFGEINKEEDVSKIFGSPPGYIGSQEIRMFEEALRKTRGGGVILLDELSNVGGNDANQKNAILKQFYNIIEEGSWTSTATGETYKLNNRIFIGTGNDGEELFFGLGAEDLRLAVWREHNNRNELRQMLIRKGWPEALLARATDIMLMKPLLESDMLNIVDKFMAPVVVSFAKIGFHIEFDEDFKKALVQTFFSTEEGGRGIRKIIDTRLKSLISKLISELYNRDLPSDSIAIKVRMTDTLTDRPYTIAGEAPRTVTFFVQAQQNGSEVLSMSSDVTSAAPPKRLLNQSDALRVSLHEAGHAVANSPEITGESVEMITIRGSGQYLGYARYEAIPGQERVSYDRKVVLHKMAKSYAGNVAQRLGGYPQDSGWAQDLKQIRALGAEYLINWGLESEFRAVQLDANGNPILSGEKQVQFESQLEKLMDEARDLALQILLEKWDLVRAVVDVLMEEGSIDGPTYLKLVQEFESKGVHNTWFLGESGLAEMTSPERDQAAGEALTCSELLASGL